MSQTFMPMPKTERQWKELSGQFENKWDFPHCCGAIDGKHIMMIAPPRSGSLFYNYKSTYSIVLLALVDANLKFIMVDIGAYGMNNDAGIFRASKFGKAIADDKLNLPADSCLEKAEHYGPLPYLFVGDEAFPLSRRMLRPFGGRGHNEKERIFNYRLSRARRIVENAFGVLASRWRVFHTKIAVMPRVCVKIVQAACILHNFLQRTSTPLELASVESEPEPVCGAFKDLTRAKGHRQLSAGNEVRDVLAEYFIREGELEWQYNKIRLGQFTKQ